MSLGNGITARTVTFFAGVAETSRLRRLRSATKTLLRVIGDYVTPLRIAWKTVRVLKEEFRKEDRHTQKKILSLGRIS